MSQLQSGRRSTWYEHRSKVIPLLSTNRKPILYRSLASVWWLLHTHPEQTIAASAFPHFANRHSNIGRNVWRRKSWCGSSFLLSYLGRQRTYVLPLYYPQRSTQPSLLGLLISETSFHARLSSNMNTHCNTHCMKFTSHRSIFWVSECTCIIKIGINKVYYITL
jgi:hypothetical protein